MDEIVVDVVRAQAAQLLFEDAVQVGRVSNGAVRKLGRNEHALAQAQLLERLPHAGLVARVEVGGIKIVDAPLDGAGDDLARLTRVGTAERPGKAHATEAERRDAVAISWVHAVLHGMLLSFASATSFSPDLAQVPTWSEDGS